MNKLLLITAIYLFGFTTVNFAQDYDYDDDDYDDEPNTGFSFRLGVKGGLNFANFDSDLDTDGKTGFHAGAFTTFKFSRIALQPEIVFSQQGGTVNIDGNDLESSYSYVNVPILLKVYLVGGLNLQVGPQFGFVASAERDEFDQLTGATSTEDAKDELKDAEVSLGLGLGWDLPFGFVINGRYNIGLTEINDSDPSWNAKNQVFQVSLGYRLIQIGE